MSDANCDRTSAPIGTVVATHYNNIEEIGIEKRKESRIYYLRNLNNWIKSILIAEFIDGIKRKKGWNCDLNVLDIGCGKGGDLRKYRIGKITHLVCTDIAEVSLDQCKERYQEMKKFSNNRGPPLFTVEFIAADSTKELLNEKFKNPKIEFDLVSVQFAFHYCFESFSQMRCMMKNVANNLREGGYFIATIPDCYEIVKRLKHSESLSFGNDVYSVTFSDEIINDSKPIPLFGAKYNFHLEGVVDCPEFLVYFPMLEVIAKEFGLKLLYRKPFGDYFKENEGKGRTLLSKMSALETYPPQKGKSLVGNSDDYTHVEDFVEMLKSEGKFNERIKVGTMSESEWEALTLYTVFAFVKQK